MGYLEAQQGADGRTAFRQAEKKYKLYKEVTAGTRHKSRQRGMQPVAVDLSHVLDLRETMKETASPSGQVLSGVHVIQDFDWPVVFLDAHPGFYFIPEALTPEEQVRLVRASLQTFPEPPNRTNHDVLHGPIHGLWDLAQLGRLLPAPRDPRLAASSAADLAMPIGPSSASSAADVTMSNGPLSASSTADMVSITPPRASSAADVASATPQQLCSEGRFPSASSAADMARPCEAPSANSAADVTVLSGPLSASAAAVAAPAASSAADMAQDDGSGQQGAASEDRPPLNGLGSARSDGFGCSEERGSGLDFRKSTLRERGDGDLEGQGCESTGSGRKEAVGGEEGSKAGEGKRGEMVEARTVLRKLRWATLGLQYDWSQRNYNPSLPYSPIPPDLAELAARLAVPALQGSGRVFRAEAAIVNFYGPGDMLSGHLDDVEADIGQPIVSISLGCKAVFLLGGRTRDEEPTAMFLRSGDVVLMAGPTRHCYHGVPRIFTDEAHADLPVFMREENCSTDFLPFAKYMASSRININVREVGVS